MSNFYVATEDGEHLDIFIWDVSIFEALCAYYQAINDGSEGVFLELELGQMIVDERGVTQMEPLESYEFKQ